jgi:hypothetical protein
MIKIPYTLQEVFNIVSTHLLKQNKRSVNATNNCMYRGPDGMKCAAGVLIPDEEYNPHLERKNWTTLVGNYVVEDKFRLEITRLQFLHDSCTPAQWPEKLKEFAIKHNLEFNCTIS